jgi:hypothetical protein
MMPQTGAAAQFLVAWKAEPRDLLQAPQGKRGHTSLPGALELRKEEGSKSMMYVCDICLSVCRAEEGEGEKGYEHQSGYAPHTLSWMRFNDGDMPLTPCPG